jgi:hypothetical protein
VVGGRRVAQIDARARIDALERAVSCIDASAKQRQAVVLGKNEIARE